MVISKHIKLKTSAKTGKPILDNVVRLSKYIADVQKSEEQSYEEDAPSEVMSFDDYEKLADYMAVHPDAVPEDKKLGKLHSLWIENCVAGDSLEFLDMATVEIKETQAQNQRAKVKTYHLLVSFRKEDESPSEEVLRDMEQEYAKVLGFEEHQRVVACHQDTDNFHFHVAYNKIHPETFKSHNPSWDYFERDRVNREMEKKHGLSMDNGVKKYEDKEQEKKPTGATDMEAHRWEESFDGYVKRHKDDLKKVVSEAKTWKDVHEGFAEYDLKFKVHANGLVIASMSNERYRVKASGIDRGFSKASLEKRFGAFQAPKDGKKKKAKDRYKPRPTTKHKGQERLWKQYRANEKAWHKGWKSFLFQMALVQDPLAIAIIQAQKRLIHALSLGSKKSQGFCGYKPKGKNKKRALRQNDNEGLFNRDI